MNAIGPMKTALLIDESRKIFKVSRQAFVDPAILEAERARISINAGSISVTAPSLPTRRLRHPSGRGPEHPVRPRRQGKSEGDAEHLPASWRAGLPGETRQREVVPVFLSRLGIRPRRHVAEPARRDVLCRGLQGTQHIQYAAGAAAGELPRSEFHLLRQECRESRRTISARSRNISM